MGSAALNLLLDTQALLWWWTDDPQLSSAAREAIADEANCVFVSAVSAFEIALRHRLGKLGHVGEMLRRYEGCVADDDFRHLPLNHRHALHAGQHEAAHRDPFNRLLAAQSALENLPLVTRDPAFGQFGIQTIW